MKMAIVTIDNLVKRYGDLVAVDHFNLCIEEGEIFGLLGPNGSGKTTTIHCLLALLQYDKGTIRIFGEEMKPTSYEIKRDIGVIMQNVAVFQYLTVEQNIDYFCGLYVNDKEKRKQLVQEAINFVELEEYRKFYPKKLSGGLLRRLNIACGIAHKPKLIILDEPTVAVDPQSRNKILEGILRLNEEGATIIYTSHYMEEVEQICSRIAIMDKGKNLALGTAEELKAMIKMGETITIDMMALGEEVMEQIRHLPHYYNASYENGGLKVQFEKGKHNLIRLLDVLQKNEVGFGSVYSQLPTLNDVFLEITGKELRD
jgi:ABC-2 type transport system ATP-binding protein